MKTLEITHENVPLIITGKFTPADHGVMYHSDMSGTPPTSAYFEIETIKVSDSDINIVELFTNFQIELFENICLIELL